MTGAIAPHIPIDPTLSGVENIFALIKAANVGTRVTSALVTLGVPTSWTSPTDDWRHTEVIATALPTSPWFGTEAFHYHRIDLATLSTGLQYDKSVASSAAALMPAMVTQFKLIGDDVLFDVTDIPVPAIDAVFVTMNLKAIDNSYAYIGTLPITITGYIPDNSVLSEDGSVMLMEDGTAFLLETA